MKKLFTMFFLFQCLVTMAHHTPVSVFITAGQSNADGRVYNTQLPFYIKANGYIYTMLIVRLYCYSQRRNCS